MPTPQARLATMLDHATAADPSGVLLYFHTPAEAEAFLADYTRFAAQRGAEPEKMAPVQGYSAGIPWSMHLRAYDVYCKKYSPQEALIEGWCRGGFATGELDEFIPGWREELSELHQLRAEVATLKASGAPPQTGGGDAGERARVHPDQQARFAFYEAFRAWFMQSGVDFWNECDAPESLATIAVEIQEATVHNKTKLPST